MSLGNDQIVLPLAQTKIRESDTVIKAASGEIVVIAGLTQSSYTEQESKTPVLGDVPILGEMFKNRSRTQVKKELVILIKPTVVGNGTHRRALRTTRDLMKKWYKG